jgi:hypothetical protein
VALSRWQQARLVYGWGHRRKDLRAYGVSTGERSAREGEGYLSFAWMADRVRPVFNDPSARVLAVNKWVFYRLMDGFGIPIPPTLGLYHPINGVSWDGQRRLRTTGDVLAEVQRARPAGLVLKPAGGWQAKGLLILDEIDYETGRAVTRTGTVTTLEAALASVDIAVMRDSRGYIVQEPVPSHPVLQELAPWTTNTLRVVTLVDLSGDVHVLGVTTALGRRGFMANNLHTGGISVSTDLETGTLTRGVMLDSTEPVTVHPDTGATLTGVRIPGWEDVMETCRRAALIMPGVRSIGWDVVVTPDGPVFLEANQGWDLRALQVHGTGFLCDPQMRARLVAAGAPLPTGSLRNAPLQLRRDLRKMQGDLRAAAKRRLPKDLHAAAKRLLDR